MLRFKPEVRFGYLDARLARVLALACQWSARERIDVCVNSANDGPEVHIPTSLHPQDLALDVGPIPFGPVSLRSLAEYLRVQLDPQYDVVLEDDHAHVEWDAHRPHFA